MGIASNQELVQQYASGITDALGTFLDTSSFGRPEADTASFLLENDTTLQGAVSATSSLQSSGTSFAASLNEAAEYFAEQDRTVATGFGDTR